MEPEKEQPTLREFMSENQHLLEENNRLLHLIHRQAVWSFWIKVVWVAILFGVPILAYHYILGPYFESFGYSPESLQNMLENWKQLYATTPWRNSLPQ